MNQIYERLAEFLDELPAGYPRTESGVELRILEKLFTPEEAALCLHLALLSEEPRVVAYRANLPVEQAARRLEEMERKGLVYGVHKPGRPPEYGAMQFVVGFWEGQVNRLDRELVELFEEYVPSFGNAELWKKAPQLRTIPVGESIDERSAALPYERAEQIIRGHAAIAVTNCICRQEKRLIDEGCDKPIETCLTFGGAAHSSIYNGRGREISQEEALGILILADKAGLVLQAMNAREPSALCMCCGDCCGVLRILKMHPQPGRIASSPYVAVHDPALCSGCGTCEERCQMEAITLPDGTAVLNVDRCIGCGLCVTTCETGALSLRRKPEPEQASVPKDVVGAYLKLGQARGKLGMRDLAAMAIKSKADRVKANLANGTD